MSASIPESPTACSREALFVLLKSRTKELNELREKYFSELILLRGQLFGVKIKKENNAKAITFQMESDLELNHAARQALASATQEAEELQSSLDPKLELKRLKLMINKTISNQSMKMDVLLNALRRKVAAVEEKNNTTILHNR